MTTLLSLLIPLASQTHYAALIAVRVMQGVFEVAGLIFFVAVPYSIFCLYVIQGLTHPAMYAILGMWAPPKERTVLIAIAHSGIITVVFRNAINMSFLFFLLRFHRLRYIVGSYNWFYGIGCTL